MNSKLKQLLEKIDYKNSFEEGEKRVERILAEYRSEKNTIDSIDELRELLSSFTSKLFNAMFQFKEPFELDHSLMFSKAIEYLEKDYPNRTELTIFKIVKSGAEGGVYKILKILAKNMNDQIFIDSIKREVSAYINGLDFDERETAAKEYLEEYGDILPANYKDDPFSVVISLERVLIEHPFMIKRLRELS